ncbi:glycoside hydrolase family 43 protein [Aquabacterium sp. OR-4]|uniref:glycoside hydrolase family 43 protein n=1 Tax=Aquabacterium sp. OR-4 TaxID=2978127 RepID=UPI0028C8576F|nr:glycoside hydrolase family 43 protein [Aquabacterium sp. OR-4]MDT7838005.1 glycoside hydrolase family 43 protein [Aquabacterium sp. OR-4]
MPAAPLPADAFTNPVLPGQEAGDPWVLWHEGQYYMTATLDPGGGLWIYRSPRLSDWRQAERRKVWSAEPSGPRSAMIWAPELHHLDGRWYLYYTASDQVDANHRHYVLEADQPLGPYRDLGRVHNAHERYAIDGSVLRLADGRLYWMYADDGLWIAPMSSPARADGPGVRIAQGEHDWERGWHKRPDGRWEAQREHYWIEAPQALQRGGRDFVVYSAGHTAAVYYLGLLELVGRDPMQPGSWRKHAQPVFGPAAAGQGHGGVHAPGHCSFTRSPDGREDWLVYHAKDVDANDAAGRTMRIQRFGWSADGLPQFGPAIASGVPQARPSGER